MVGISTGRYKTARVARIFAGSAGKFHVITNKTDFAQKAAQTFWFIRQKTINCMKFNGSTLKIQR